MVDVHCQECDTSVTSIWSRDELAKEIVCPNCQTRQPEPFQEIENWIFPFRVRGLQLTRRWIVAIAFLFVLLALGVGIVSISRTPVASNVSSQPPKAPDGETVDPTQPRKPPGGEIVGSTQQSEPPGGEHVDATQPSESPGGEPVDPAQASEPSDGEPVDVTQPPEPPRGDPIDPTRQSEPPDDESVDPTQRTTASGDELVDGEPRQGEPLSALSMPPCFFVRQSPVCGIAASPRQLLLAFAHEDGTVRFWDIRKGFETQQTLKSRNGSPVGMSFHPGGRLLALLFRDGWELYDIAHGDLQVSTPSMSRLSAVAFSGDGKYLAVAESRGGIVIRRMPDLSIVKEQFGLDGILCVCWCDSRKQFVAASSDNVARFWVPGKSRSLGERELPTRLVGHLDWISCLAQVPSTTTLLTGSWDKSVRAWDARSGEMLTEFRGHGQRVSAIAASPDGQLVASGTDAGVVKTWDMATGMEKCTFRGHQERITGIAFVGNRWIVTASADGSAKAWDATTGNEGLPSPAEKDSQSQQPTDPRETQAAKFGMLIEEANEFQKQKLYNAAAEKYREAIQMRPHYAEPHGCLGECLFELGEVLEAIKSFRTAVRLQPTSGYYKYNLGMALLTIDHDREAVAVLKEACQLLPDLDRLRLSLGEALCRQGQYSDAAAEFQEAIKLAPQSPEAHHRLGVAYGQLRQWKLAETELKKAIELDRKYAPAYSDLIEVILASGSQPPRQAAYWAQLANTLDIAIRPDTMQKLNNAALYKKDAKRKER